MSMHTIIFDMISEEFHYIIDLIGNFSEPILLFLHNIKTKYLDIIKISVKLIIHFISLLKLFFYLYMIFIFETKEVNLDKLIIFENYPILSSVWQGIKSENGTDMARAFIAECRNITLEKNLPHYYITKSLNMYTLAKLLTFAIGIYDLYKIMKEETKEKKD